MLLHSCLLFSNTVVVFVFVVYWCVLGVRREAFVRLCLRWRRLGTLLGNRAHAKLDHQHQLPVSLWRARHRPEDRGRRRTKRSSVLSLACSSRVISGGCRFTSPLLLCALSVGLRPMRGICFVFGWGRGDGMRKWLLLSDSRHESFF